MQSQTPKTQLSEINEAARGAPEALIAQDNGRYHAQIRAVADEIELGAGRHTIILLAGPSGAGKTTTAHNIAAALEHRGAGATTISLDNFYLGLGFAPKHEDGSFDYETVHALDLPLVHEAFLSLITHGRCIMPRFDFMKGARAADSIEIELEENGIAIVEGIHAMNPLIADSLPKECLKTVYISVESGVYEGDDQLLSPRNMRLCRRIVRDSIFRNSSPENTLDMWSSVVSGEARYLLPYKDLADVTIDSFHSSEPCVFRSEILRLCATVEEGSPGYQAARSLMAGVAPFAPICHTLVPADSLLREFIGGVECA